MMESRFEFKTNGNLIACNLRLNKTGCFALPKFKELIANDPFDIFTSWNDSKHLCKWQGITCDHKHQRVI
jgi:hypothetical protein